MQTLAYTTTHPLRHTLLHNLKPILDRDRDDGGAPYEEKVRKTPLPSMLLHWRSPRSYVRPYSLPDAQRRLSPNQIKIHPVSSSVGGHGGGVELVPG